MTSLNIPKVSIIMITKDRARWLPAAIESILAQTFVDWELLIIDSGSTDGTKELVNTYAVSDGRIFYQDTVLAGIAPKRNLALRQARGKYIAVLDSDDVWLEAGKLETQVNFLDSDADYVVIGSDASLIDEAGKVIGQEHKPKTDEQIRASMTRKDNLIHSSVLYRRDLALKAGAYAESLLIGEDYDLWLRLGLVGKLVNLPLELIGYRVHRDNMGEGRLKKVFFTGYSIAKKYFSFYPHPLVNRLKWFYGMARYIFKRDIRN